MELWLAQTWIGYLKEVNAHVEAKPRWYPTKSGQGRYMIVVYDVYGQATCLKSSRAAAAYMNKELGREKE